MTQTLSATYADAEQGAATSAMTRDEFDLFYRQTAPALGSYIRRMTGTADDDLLQDAYVRLLSVSPVPAESNQLRAYLYRIATRLVLDRWRRERRHRAYTSEAAHAAGAELPAADSGFERCFMQLAARERMMLWLAHVEGMDHREVAAAMGCNATSVRVMLFRARRKLEGILRMNGWNAS